MSTVHLPRSLLPTHYDVAIKTDFTNSPPSYSGEIIVTLDVRDDVNEIHFSLHPEVKITHVTLCAGAVFVVPLQRLSIDAAALRAAISLKNMTSLKAGTDTKLWLRFESPLATNMMGYYKSEGALDDGRMMSIYTLTQFESVGARRAFPCWDQPEFKATWSLSMIAAKDMVVLGNMPAEASRDWSPAGSDVFSESYELGSSLDTVEGYRITEFEKTPLMSTYLVAFACGNFEHLSSEFKSVSGKTVPLRFYATANHVKQGQFALDVTRTALPMYEEMFDIPFNLPKLDTLAADDFDSGAMENWGLIAGRSEAYLYDPDSSPLASRKLVASNQCHELAHMWFGNLVTMKWWDNLWLKEAFATLMGEVILPDRIWPEWKPRQAFVNNHFMYGLGQDALRSSHPIEVPCPTENAIYQIFDGISYSKGAAVLRMLSAVVGEATFLKGIARYLQDNLYGNTETKDLWKAIAWASGMDIASMMDSWILKVGYPVLNVEEVAGGIRVTQNRFLFTGDVEPSDDETLWWVPLGIKTVQTGAIEHASLDTRSAEFSVAPLYKLNGDTTGFYRIKYPPHHLRKLGRSAHLLSVEDRVGLISDVVTLARAGYCKTSEALSYINECNEDEKSPLEAIANVLDRVALVWWEQREPVRTAIDSLRINLFKRIVDHLGYDPREESTEQQEIQVLAVTATADAGDAEVVSELRARFAPVLNGEHTRVPADLQRIIFTTAIRHGGEQEYRAVLEMYTNPPTPAARRHAITAMCSAIGEEQISETFRMMMDGRVKDQDLASFCTGLGRNPSTRRRVVQWFMENHKEITDRLAGSMNTTNIVRATLSTLTSHEDLDMVKRFFNSIDHEQYKMTVNQVYDTIQAAANWLHRDTDDVEQWFKANGYLGDA